MPGTQSDPYVHATVVALGEAGVLIRGRSGAGKSSLAMALLDLAGPTLSVRLIGDDRIALRASHGRLVARAHPVLQGLIEQRGEGVLTAPRESAAVVRCVVDLGTRSSCDIPPRFPEQDGEIAIQEVVLPRLRLPGSLPPVEAARRVSGFVHRLVH